MNLSFGQNRENSGLNAPLEGSRLGNSYSLACSISSGLWQSYAFILECV